MKLTFTLALAAAGAVLTIAPARADFCGVPDDINPLVKLTIATYPKVSHSSQAIDQSYIKTLSVNGTYAYSVTQDGSKRNTFYWEKPTGTWHLAAANHPPADWDKMILNFFSGDDSCNNPNWKKRP